MTEKKKKKRKSATKGKCLQRDCNNIGNAEVMTLGE